MKDKDAFFPTQFSLYGDDGYDSHVVRFLLEEKGVSYDFVLGNLTENSDELASLNPYKTLPILVNREINLYEINIIVEYLEERHPANRLLPSTPKERAFVRTLAWRIQKDWLSLAKVLLTHPDSFSEQANQEAKKTLTDTLTTIAPLFAQKPFFVSDTITVCDIWLVPMLWRLEMMGIELPKTLCRPLFDYQDRLTARPSFVKSLL